MYPFSTSPASSSSSFSSSATQSRTTNGLVRNPTDLFRAPALLPTAAAAAVGGSTSAAPIFPSSSSKRFLYPPLTSPNETPPGSSDNCNNGRNNYNYLQSRYFSSSSSATAAAPAIATTSASPFVLPQLVLGDVLVAAAVTAAAAPFLTIVDKGLVERAASNKSLLLSAQESILYMVQHPWQYVKSPTFLWMWATYGATYSAANALKTVTEYYSSGSLSSSSSHYQHHQEQTQTPSNTTTSFSWASSAVFFGTTATNSTASLLKDRAYARLFGNQQTTTATTSITTAAPRVPVVSYGFWLARDFTVIGSSFILPEYVAPLLQTTGYFSSSQDEQQDQSLTTTQPSKRAQQVAQIITPMAAQVVAGPLHLIGLDVYNRRLCLEPAYSESFQQRWLERGRFLKSCFGEVVVARILRIVPGYGIAGIWNKALREEWKDYVTVESKQEQGQNGQHQPSSAVRLNRVFAKSRTQFKTEQDFDSSL